MKLNSIQGSMGLFFMAFFLLVIVSAGAIFWGIESQKKDTLVINLAGRPRMLVQQTTRLAFGIEKSQDDNQVSALQEASYTLEQNLNSLKNGGLAPYLPGSNVKVPAANDASIQGQLQVIQQSWQSFRRSLEVIQSSKPGNTEFNTAIQTVKSRSPEFISQADLSILMYEAASNLKTTRLGWTQIGFFSNALALLVGVSLMARKSIIKPPEQLERATRSIGKGDLSTRVDDEEKLFQAIKKGAQGYVVKNLCPKEMLRILRGVIQGEAALSPSLERRMLKEFRRLSKIVPFEIDDELVSVVNRQRNYSVLW